MRCVAIGGQPATGKTTLVTQLYKNLNEPQPFKFGLVRGHLDKSRNLAVVGIYGTGETFLGTDKLAMNVNPHFHKYADKKARNILFEGDRLFTEKNLLRLMSLYETRVIILRASEAILSERHKERGDTQSKKFLQSRRTKMENIEKKLGSAIEFHYLKQMKDSFNLAENLLSWLSDES
jgi:cytidylate kinase